MSSSFQQLRRQYDTLLALELAAASDKKTYSGFSTIPSFVTAGRIYFYSPALPALTYIPSVVLQQVSAGAIVNLRVTDITTIDFGFAASGSSIGGISWIAK